MQAGQFAKNWFWGGEGGVQGLLKRGRYFAPDWDLKRAKTQENGFSGSQGSFLGGPLAYCF